MESMADEWELSGYVVFKDSIDQSVGVMLSRDGLGWDRFYVKRKEFWLDMGETAISTLRWHTWKTLTDSENPHEVYIAGFISARWHNSVPAILRDGVIPYEKLSDLSQRVLGHTSKEAVARMINQVFDQFSNAVSNKRK